MWLHKISKTSKINKINIISKHRDSKACPDKACSLATVMRCSSH